MTLIEITNKLKHYAENQFSNPTVLVGSLYENMNTKELRYPVINLDSLSTTKRNNELVYNFSVFYADRLNENSGNLLDIQSQGTTSLQLFLHNILNSGIISLDDYYAIEIQTYKLKFTDVCAGAYMELSIHAMDDINYCDLPDVDTITITRNGEYDVALYEKANINVQPSGGTIEITQNGTYDVTDYTTAEVNLSIGDNGNYFYFQSRQNGSKLKFRTPSSTPIPLWSVSLEYSTDKVHWTEWDFSAITMDSGDTVYFRGNNPYGFNDAPASGRRWCFETQNGRFNIGGDIRSLIDKTMNVITLPTWCFTAFFYGANIVEADKKLLSGFSSLELGCFKSMFYGCKYLTQAPDLPWERIADQSFNQMLYGCSSLVTAPEIGVRNFQHYASPQMFKGCSSLTYIKYLATGDPTNTGCLSSWVEGVAANGTFVRDYNSTWPVGNDGIPTGWTVLVDNVPESVIQQ